ncbi:MAG: aldo/keto reductase [Deltaproteobacteria bacterium]|nr:aldo/keto reductase [Deltaproteobacteria bacterium]MBW2311917.1 aldo/keto reductase [Deltaproteobacteria bacterium]
MERVVLGKTGLEVNRLGFGGIPIQRVTEKQAVEVVLHAIENGMDFIDTSRAYTTSERRIGKALQKTDKRVVLASKSHGRTSDTILRDLETSLRELNRDYIDLYQAHFVADEQVYTQVISSGGALEGLHKAREEGLIGHMGITSHSLDLLDRILDDGLFETIMVCFSLLEPTAREKIIPKAIEKNVGIIAMKPFSGGVIENASLALKYVLSQPGVVVIAGVEQVELFDENWAIFRGSWELNDAEKAEIKEIQSSYEKNFCHRCDYCQPCTENIAIQQILGIRSMVRRMGTRILVEGYQAKAIEKARNCTECGECMTRCPYELPIPDLIKENLEWVDEQLKAL